MHIILIIFSTSAISCHANSFMASVDRIWQLIYVYVFHNSIVHLITKCMSELHASMASFPAKQEAAQATWYQHHTASYKSRIKHTLTHTLHTKTSKGKIAMTIIKQHKDSITININMYAMNGNAVMTTCRDTKVLSCVHTIRHHNMVNGRTANETLPIVHVVKFAYDQESQVIISLNKKLFLQSTLTHHWHK